MNVPAKPPSTEPKTKLIELAARLTDLEVNASNTTKWLRAFRKNYRHMVTTFGSSLHGLNLSEADTLTDAALEPNADTKAA